MSAVSNKVTPASIAALTTLAVPAASSRQPKLLQPSPTTETSSEPMRRVFMTRECRTAGGSAIAARRQTRASPAHGVAELEAQRAGQGDECGVVARVGRAVREVDVRQRRGDHADPA